MGFEGGGRGGGQFVRGSYKSFKGINMTILGKYIYIYIRAVHVVCRLFFFFFSGRSRAEFNFDGTPQHTFERDSATTLFIVLA